MELTQTMEKRSVGERRTVLPSLTIGGYRISWGAVWAGVFAGIGVQAVLGFLGIGIGASTIDATREANPLSGLGTASVAWLFVSTLLAYFAAGWFSGRMSGSPQRSDGVHHGLVTWAFSLVVTAFLVTSAIGGLFTGASHLLGQGMAAAASNTNMSDQITSEVRNLAQGAATTVQQAANNPAVQQDAREAGDKAAEGTSKGAFLTFFVLLCSAAVCAWGGAMAVPKMARFKKG